MVQLILKTIIIHLPLDENTKTPDQRRVQFPLGDHLLMELVVSNAG